MMVKVDIFSDCMFEGRAQGTATHSNAHLPYLVYTMFNMTLTNSVSSELGIAAAA